MKTFKFWTLVDKNWAKQDSIKAKNRKEAVKSVNSKYRNGTWKLRLEG